MLTERLYAETGYLELSKMKLTTIPDICGLMPAETHTGIAFLSLAQNNIRVVNQDLSCLTNLRVLNLSYNNIVEVVKLGSLPNLQELLLHKNNLETADEIVEMELPALQKLNLAYNDIKEVANIDRFKNLTVLELQHNALETIVGVENLEKLQELKLEFNNLTDLPFIDKLKSIQSLTTEGNNLKESIAAQAKAIQQKFRNG
jgi:Leucine-rich repeat (LRR) protein